METTRTVFILGAGASKDYRGSTSKKKMPLAKEFFSTYRALDISWQWECRVGNIVNYVRDCKGIAPENFKYFDEDIEIFFSQLDEHVRSVASKAFPRSAENKRDWEEFPTVSKAYDQLILLIAQVLNEIQNGSTCPHYAEICAKVPTGTVFVTFNWDTLLDRALYETGLWWPENGYGLEFTQLLQETWRKPEQHESKFKLLKLHGSTNWLVNYTSRSLRTGERIVFNPKQLPLGLFCFISASIPYKAHRSRFRYGYAPFSYFFPPDSPVDSVPLVPLLIPPVLKKEYEEWKGIYDSVWVAAENAIREADRVVIAGYRFPPTDIRPVELLQRSVRDGTLIEIISPTNADEIRDRLKTFLSPKAEYCSHNSTLEQYIMSL